MTTRRRTILGIIATLGLGPLMVAQPHAAEIKFLSSNAIKSVIEEIAPQFEKASGHKLTITFGSTGNLSATIDKGTPFDLTVLGASAIDDFIKQGKLAGPRRDIVRSGIGVAYRQGTPKPDVSTSAALKAALLSAKAVSFNTQGLSGSHMLKVIDQMGITTQVRPKVIIPAVSAATDVAKGLAELGMTQTSEILPHAAEGAMLAGPLPADVQLYTVFAAALSGKPQQAEAAKALIDFLTAPAVVPVLKAKGLEPG